MAQGVVNSSEDVNPSNFPHDIELSVLAGRAV